MQVSLETTSGLERKLIIEVPAEKIDSQVDAKVKQAAKNVKIDGFRPGKVPFKVVKQRFGKGIHQEVVGEVMRESFVEAVKEKELKPAGAPEIEGKVVELGKNLEFVATFEVYPEIAIAELDSADEVVKKSSEVKDEDVEEMIETLRKQQASWTEVDRAAQKDDQVNYDFEGTQDGEKFDGGTAEKQNLVLGSNSMIPGFEDGIMGMKAGEEKTIDVTFPENYQAENLAGKEAQFKITVHTVSEPELPEVDAEFIKSFGVDVEDIESFKKEIRTNMERELKQVLASSVKNQVMDAFLGKNEIDVPQALVKNEIQTLKKQTLQQYGGQQANLDLDVFPDDLFKDQAQKRVTLGLLINEVISAQSLKVDDAKLNEKVEEIASTYQNPQEVKDYYNQNQQQKAQLEAVVLEEQVVDYLLSKATVKEEAVSYQEAVKPAA